MRQLIVEVEQEDGDLGALKESGIGGKIEGMGISQRPKVSCLLILSLLDDLRLRR